jgi:hypothetical protein
MASYDVASESHIRQAMPELFPRRRHLPGRLGVAAQVEIESES